MSSDNTNTATQNSSDRTLIEPIGLDPDRTLVITVPTDADLPPDQQRRLIYRFRSAREWLEYAETLNSIYSNKNNNYLEQLIDLASQKLVGVEGTIRDFEGNQIEFKHPSDIGHVLTQVELQEFCEMLPTLSTLTELQKKKSRWQSHSSTVSSVKSVTAETARA